MMVDSVEQGEQLVQRTGSQAGRLGVATTLQVTKVGVRVSAHVGRGVAQGTLASIEALLDLARRGLDRQRGGGQLSLRGFSRVVDGKRELVGVDDRRVARQLARELRRHGVTFAIERHPDGSRTIHVAADDLAILEHGLAVSAERVDARILRKQERVANREGTKAPEQREPVAEPVDETVAAAEHDRALALGLALDEQAEQLEDWAVDAETWGLDERAATLREQATQVATERDTHFAAHDITADDCHGWEDARLADQTRERVTEPDIAPDTLQLDDTQRAALVQELRSYADYREGDLDLDTSERAAELVNDPTYAHDVEATQAAIDHEQAQIDQLQQDQATAASPYRELADQLERDGSATLDAGTTDTLTEVFENAGWNSFDPGTDATPKPLRDVVARVDAVRQERGKALTPDQSTARISDRLDSMATRPKPQSQPSNTPKPTHTPKPAAKQPARGGR